MLYIVAGKKMRRRRRAEPFRGGTRDGWTAQKESPGEKSSPLLSSCLGSSGRADGAKSQ
jgi:hypothetical protein